MVHHHFPLSKFFNIIKKYLKMCLKKKSDWELLFVDELQSLHDN